MNKILAVLGLGAVSCAVFDESLLDEVEDTEMSLDTSLDEAPLLADQCFVDDLPVITESVSMILDLGAYQSAGLGYPLCPGPVKEFPGADAYFKLQAKAGERWNVNAAPQQPDLDVVILNLGSGCTPTGCRAAQNRCDVGFNEDFAVIAEEDTEYVIAIDSTSTVPGTVALTLDKSVCGNQVVEAGETCDGGDGCDSECRRVVFEGTVQEGEPNDIFTGVDMIGDAEQDTTVRVRGSVGGKCDEDHYAFIVPEGANVSVRMFGGDGAPCPEGTSEIELPFVDFWADGGPRPLGAGIIDLTSGSGACPFIDGVGEAREGMAADEGDFGFARDLPASEYHLIINARVTPAPIPYEIEFEIDVP